MRETAIQAVDWIELAAQIQVDDKTGLVCYRVFSRLLRYFLLRQIGEQECDDRMHEILIIVVRADLPNIQAECIA